MIRKLQPSDYHSAIGIVNENWKRQYAGYINPQLVNEHGCQVRSGRMKEDFLSGRLQEYVWEENGEVLALLSIGPTADDDRPDAFEIWRIYISPIAQGRGIGKN